MSADQESEETTEWETLAIGEKWGAYWKHPDGWMRLYPPLLPSVTTPGDDAIMT